MEKAAKPKRGRKKGAPAAEKMRQCPNETCEAHDLDLGISHDLNIIQTMERFTIIG